METTNNVECQYCKKKFKKDSYLAKHQKTAKYCIIIQKKIAGNDIEDSIQNLMIAKDSINKEIDEMEDINVSTLNNLEELDKKKIDEIHSLYLNFEKEKISIENEYNSNTSSFMSNNNIHNSLNDYYNLDKIKILKLHNIYTEFENKKKEVQDKYDSIIQEEKQYEEEEKRKNDSIWKEVLKTEKLKQLEDTFELIKNKIITIIDTTEDIKNISEILTNKIFKLNDILELNKETNTIPVKNIVNVEDNIPNEFREDNNKNKKQRLKRQNEEIENKLLYHLVLLLQDQKINNDTLMYIIVELMKHMNNYQIKGQDKKSSILFILRNFINTNNGDIINREDIKIFTDKYLEEFINIVSALSDKKIRIKLKKNCFLPICF